MELEREEIFPFSFDITISLNKNLRYTSIVNIINEISKVVEYKDNTKLQN